MRAALLAIGSSVLAVGLLVAQLALSSPASALTVTLRPNATVQEPPAGTFGPCSNFNRVGADTHWQATSDNSDSSYYWHNRDCEESEGPLKLNFADISLPSGAVKKSIRLRVRHKAFFAPSGVFGVRGYLSKQNVDWVGCSTPQPAGIIAIVETSGTAMQTTAGPEASLANVTIAEINGAEWGGISGFTCDFDPSNDDEATQIVEAYADVIYVPRPTATVTVPTGTISQNRPTVQWDRTLDSDGGSQTRFEAKIFTDAAVGSGGFDPNTSDAVSESGEVSSSDSQWQPDDWLFEGKYHAYVRVAQTVNGALHWSQWDSEEFTVDSVVELKREAACIQSQPDDPDPSAGGPVCQAVGAQLQELTPRVLGPWSDTCTASNVRVADGFAGTTYVKLRIQQVDQDTVWVCFRTNNPSAPLGGRLEIEGPVASPPGLDEQSDACTAESGSSQNTVPGNHPMLSGEIGDSSEPETHAPYMIDAFADADRAWFCLEAKDLHRRAIVPIAGQIPPAVTLLSDNPPPAAPNPDPPPAGYPSADCPAGAGGEHVRALNADAGADMHVWLESWRDGSEHAKLCVRLQGPISVGGAFTVDATASPGVEVVAAPGEDMAACPINVFTNDQADLEMKRSSQGQNPASICVRDGATVKTVTAGTEGELVPPTVAWQFDPDALP